MRLTLQFCFIFLWSSHLFAAKAFNLKDRDYSSVSGEQLHASRPFKAGFFRLSRKLDQSKPLATIDYAGWVHSSGLFIGSLDSKSAVSISARSQKEQWKIPIDGGLTSPPLVQGAWVMLATRDSYIHKVDVLSGQVIWKTRLDAFAIQRMVKFNDHLFIVTANQTLYSIDFETGKVDWAFDSGVRVDLSVRSNLQPIVHNGVVYFGLANGEIAAVGVENGKKIWQINPHFSKSQMTDIVGELVFTDNQLLFSRYDGVVGRIDLFHPDHKPHFLLDGTNSGSISTSVYRDGLYYIGFVDGRILAYKLDGNSKLWEVELGVAISYLTPGEASIYFSSASGLVGGVEIASGRLQWVDELGSNIVSPPIYLNNDVYFSTGLRNLYGYRLFH